MGPNPADRAHHCADLDTVRGHVRLGVGRERQLRDRPAFPLHCHVFPGKERVKFPPGLHVPETNYFFFWETVRLCLESGFPSYGYNMLCYALPGSNGFLRWMVPPQVTEEGQLGHSSCLVWGGGGGG